jgi:hypothetical protein
MELADQAELTVHQVQMEQTEVVVLTELQVRMDQAGQTELMVQVEQTELVVYQE